MSTQAQPVVDLMDHMEDDLPLSPIQDRGLLLSEISAAARDPQVDAAKISALLDIKERIERSRAEEAFWEALASAQDEMEPIRKDAINQENKSKWARIETVQKKLQPIYRKHGLRITWTTEQNPDPNMVPLVAVVSHRSGHRQIYRLAAEVDDKGPKGGGVKTKVQGTGSTESYLQRKLYGMIFDVIFVNDDDDGDLGRKTRPITQDQADNLETLLNDAGMTDAAKRVQFCKWAGVAKLSEIPAHLYDKAVQLLQAKAAKR